MGSRPLLLATVVSALLAFMGSAAAGLVGSEGMPGHWTVTAGDTLFSIARRLAPDDKLLQGRLRAQLLQMNPQAFPDGTPNSLVVGSRLRLPEWFSPPTRNDVQSDPLHWEVKRGDTLFSIARALAPGDRDAQRNTRAQILAANPDAFEDGDPDRIRKGFRLTLPGRRSPSRPAPLASARETPSEAGGPEPPAQGVLAETKPSSKTGDAQAPDRPAKARPSDQKADPAHEYFRGVSSIVGGRVEEGVSVLERLSRAYPEDNRVRLRLAQGYFMLGTYGRARDEFSFVLANEPSAEARQTAERHLELIAQREGGPAADTPPEKGEEIEDVIRRMQELYESGDAAGAYELATRDLSRYEGDPYFDYIYGVAAIDSGHLTEGVFALERVLLAFPDDDRARLELARGFFLLEDFARAQTEFTRVMRKDPPEEVQASIQGYLDAMRIRERRFRLTPSAYAEVGFGHDDNVNSAPADANFFTPKLGVGTLAPEAREKSDSFFQGAAGGQLVHSLRPGRSVYAGIDLRRRFYLDEDRFDTGSVTGSLGLSLLSGRNRYNLALQSQYFTLDDSSYRWLYGANGQWRRALGQRSEVLGFGTFNRLDYPDQSVRNSFLATAGFGGRHRFDLPWSPELYAGAYGGREQARDNDSAAKSLAQRNLIGARVTGQITPLRDLGLYSSISWQWNDYRGRDFLFEKRRDDAFYSAEGGFTYLLFKNWSLRGDISYYRNDSNIAVQDYDRTQVMMRLRYEHF